MANNIKIGVEADLNTDAMQAELQSVRRAFNALAADAAKLGKQRIEPISKASVEDARRMNAQFSEMLRLSSGLRRNLESAGQGGKPWHGVDWSKVFPDPGQRQAYAGTLAGRLRPGSVSGIEPRPVPGGGYGGGVPPTPSERAHGVHGRAAGAGMAGVGKIAGAGLALAGVGSVMAMAGRAVDLAKQEATATDQLLRKSGDLSQSFDGLREKLRASGEGLGVLHVEAAQLANQYVSTANGQGGDIGGNLRTGFGLSRAYGLELSEGVGFMAQMRHQGQVKDGDKDGRKLAALIAEAIERGQSTGKAGEFLQAVSGFSSQVARLALSPANVAGFGGALASLTSSNDIGFKGDPTNSASMLMTADNAVRRGGGMGEASLNFQYGALNREMPGLSPIAAKAVMEQGLFGSGVSSSIQKYAKDNRVQLPQFSSKSNWRLLKAELDTQYRDDPMIRLEALKNHFQLGSLGHAAAMYNMNDDELTGLEKSGLDINSLKASSLQGVGRIGIANDDELKGMAGKLSERKDLTDTERSNIKAKLDDGDMKGLREVMLKAVSIREQEKNVGTETRDAVNALHNTLTDIGGVVLPAITGIQEGVVAMARAIAPDSDYAKNQKLQEGVAEYKARKVDLLAGHQKQLAELGTRLDTRGIDGKQREFAIGQLKELHQAEIYKFTRENDNYEDFINKDKRGGAGGAGSIVDGIRQRNSQLTAPAQPIDLGITPVAARPAGGGGLFDAVVSQESGGRHYGSDGQLLRSGKGARGIAQIMPGTGGDPGYGVRPLQNDSEEEHRRFGSDYLAAMMKEFGGDKAKALAAYNAGPGAVQKSIRRNGDAWLQHMPKETQDYVPGVLGRKHSADGFSGDVPAGNPAGSPTQPIVARVEGAFQLHDSMGAPAAPQLDVSTRVTLPSAAGAGGL